MTIQEFTDALTELSQNDAADATKTINVLIGGKWLPIEHVSLHLGNGEGDHSSGTITLHTDAVHEYELTRPDMPDAANHASETSQI